MSDDLISRQAAIDELKRISFSHRFECGEYLSEDIREIVIISSSKALEAIEALPSAEPEWNNHTVACLLAEMFGDDCACNFNGIDEWLPEKCEVIDSCPHPVGVACWEQFLKHGSERRTDE